MYNIYIYICIHILPQLLLTYKVGVRRLVARRLPLDIANALNQRRRDGPMERNSDLFVPLIWSCCTTEITDSFLYDLERCGNFDGLWQWCSFASLERCIFTLNGALNDAGVTCPDDLPRYIASLGFRSDGLQVYGYFDEYVQEGILSATNCDGLIAEVVHRLTSARSRSQSRARARSVPVTTRSRQEQTQRQAVAKAKAVAKARGTSPTPEAERCQICQCRLTNPTTSWPHCGHRFHRECVNRMREASDTRDLTCPTCHMGEDGIPLPSACPHGLWDTCDVCGTRCRPHNLWSALTGCEHCFGEVYYPKMFKMFRMFRHFENYVGILKICNPIHTS